MSDVTRPRERRRSSPLLFVRDLAIIILAALLVSFLVKTFLIQSFFIPSESMENTLLVGDHIVVNELVPGVVGLHRGDVVVFTDPGGWLDGEQPVSRPAQSPLARALGFIGIGASDTDDHLVKRVIGLPGDTVTCCNDLGQLSVNGVPLHEPYVRLFPGHTAASDQTFTVTVPAGDLWVMGDNRDDSADSRAHMTGPTHGFVPESDVTGRAFVLVYPFDRWSWLGDYPSVFAGVPSRDPHDR